MSEELLQRGLDKKNPTSKIGKWDYYNIGATSLKALKEAGIINPFNYGKLGSKKVDALIVNRKEVLAIIEFKQPKEFKTKKQKEEAIEQEIEVAKILGAKIIIATDRIDTVWVNALTGKEICDEKGKIIKESFDEKNEKIAELMEKINYSISEKNNKILPRELVNPTDLARSVWQDIWSVSGESPTNCLYSFVEIFIFKYLSDLKVLEEHNSFEFLMEMQKKKVTNEKILQYYADVIRKEIKSLFPANLVDNTTIINGSVFVNKEHKAVEGYSTVFLKVLNRFENYGKLENIDYDFKSQLFESFLKESDSKKNLGQFFTPMKVVRAIERIARDEIKEGSIICDPACGVGKFLLEPIKSRIEQFYTISKDGIIPKITIEGYDKGFDKEEQKTIILAKANMLIYFSELIRDNKRYTKEFSEIFNKSFTLKTDSILGTLKDPIENKYDLILTNPPYVTSGSSNLKDEIAKNAELKKHFKINAMGVEGLFMEWIVRALKPNGKAFIVVPDGIFNRNSDKNLREFIKQECYIDGIISLPLNTFFTTNKKTYILCLTKKNKKTDAQIEPVFTYLVSEIGESRDNYRFEIEQDDLVQATKLYNFFKGNKSNFNEFNKDSRCKIFPIEKFEPEENWCVDRWWSKEEKINLGIEEENKAISISDFSIVVSDMSEILNSFSNQLKDVEKKKNIKIKKYLVDDLFIIKKGNAKYTMAYLNASKNKKYDVYSSQTSNNGVVGKIDTYDYDYECLTWTTDGVYAGTVFYRNGKFSMTTHCGALILKNEKNLSLKYLQYILNSTLSQFAHGESNKRVTVDIIKKIIIEIPIQENGDFDIQAQKDIAKKYSLIQEIKTKVKEFREIIKNQNIKIDDELKNSKEVPIKEIYDIKKGLSKYTKSYGQQNKGEYPVYSASNVAPLTYINTFDYEGKYITWATNGFAGYIKVLDEKFSVNGDRGLLIPKNKDINIDYIKFVLEPILRNLAKGRKGENGEDEFTKVYPTMVEKVKILIPILPNGEFDLKKQEEIAKKYQAIEQIKEAIEKELLKLEEIKVEI